MDIKVISKNKPVKLVRNLHIGQFFSFNNDSNSIVNLYDDFRNLKDTVIFYLVELYNTKYAYSVQDKELYNLTDDLDEEVTTYKQTSPLELTEE